MYRFNQSLRPFNGNQERKSSVVAAPSSETYPKAKSIKMIVCPSWKNEKAENILWYDLIGS